MPAGFAHEMARFLPFRDAAVCERVRKIKKEDLCRHANPNFKIRIIENETAFQFGYVLDIVAGIKRSLEEGRRHVMILPAPNPNYALIAHAINELNLSCEHVHTFNWMWEDFFGRIRPELRMPDKQIHFPSTENINDYSSMVEDAGAADVCYGGIGLCGHIAFFDPHLGVEFGDDVDAYLRAGARIVELHPITILQNCLYADAGSAGDWSWTPPKAATIGPRELAAAKRVSFWTGFGCGESLWQRFITRLAAHGPVTPLVPASILQILNSELVLSGAVAADCSTETSERRIPIQFPAR